MRLILLAPPGAGKGTQAELIEQKFRVAHISTGDLLREAVKKGTILGLKAKKYMDKGKLVPDEVVIGIIKDKIKELNDFILDGFPRTLEQAKILDRILDEEGKKLDTVIEIQVPDERLVERAVGRLSCKCGEVYHEIYNPPRTEGICDRCGGKLYKREDDTAETMYSRIKTYKMKTMPLIKYYFQKGILRTVNGDQDIEKVFWEIEKILNKIKKD
ncbi:MAG: adenylate kinase [Methanomicrobia archaeon]|nr:adenylate kinase [Methanomicrobia archaeon]RLF96691.1 MAG: adenylate kinase [Thermococci archaeon]RLG01744.1 MAG: adenylate kinase [Thermococci archaeon]